MKGKFFRVTVLPALSLCILCFSCLKEEGAEQASPSTFIHFFNGGSDDLAITAEELPDEGFILLGTTGVRPEEATGNTVYKVKMIRTDRYGNQLWKSIYPPYGDDQGMGFRARSLLINKDGSGSVTGYVVVGDSIDDGGTPYPSIMTTDSEGNSQSRKTLLSHAATQGMAVVRAQSGDLLLLGQAAPDKMTLSGLDASSLDEKWFRSYSAGESSLANRLFQEADGKVVWLGTVVNYNQSDIRLIKTTPDTQSTDYSLPIGSEEFNEAASDMCAAGSFFAVAGTTSEGNGDIQLSLIGINGSVTTTSRYDFGLSDQANSVAVARDGGLIILGTVQSTAAEGGGEEDLYLIKTGIFGGEPQWSRLFGGPNADIGASVRATTDGGFIVFGTTEFGGLQTMMLVKMDSEGRVE